MADFIAVIRRAVDGLSDNTPEMRLRVYDRARTAVQRQLDNMKPRPADDVIARQLDKLDDAIATIEKEFSGPPSSEAAPTPLPEDVPPPPPVVPEPEPEPAPRPNDPEPAAAAPAQVEPARIEPASLPLAAPSPVEPPSFLMRAPKPVEEERPQPRPEPAFETPKTPEPEKPLQPEPAAPKPILVDTPEPEQPAAVDDTMPPPAPEVDETSWQRDRFDEPLGTRAPKAPVERHWDPFDRDHSPVKETARTIFDPPATAEIAPAEPEAWTPVVTDNPFHEPEEIFAPPAAQEPAARRDDPFALTPNKFDHDKPAASARSWLDDVETPASTMPAASPPATRDTSWDSFEAFVGERSGSKSDADLSLPKMQRGRDGMAIGAEAPPRETQRAIPAKEERESRGKLIAGIAAGILVLAGVGYAGWRFSDNILGFVNGSSSSSQTASKSQPAATPATTTAPTNGAKPAATPTTTPVVTGPQKFTQRLMADGSEVDSGTSGEQVANAAQSEGKSVASQNEKPPAQPANAQPPAQTTDTTAPSAAGQTNTENAQQSAPVKMFLYEERLGQASPTALEGTVTWSVKTDDQDGHKEKMIQGDISVPGRKMSAIFTVRKNNDPTLPASHIIELTFSLPKEFEGRGIESVLRISMKEKEQEQGDALVAVPAKITDYFHMIALNAFADAVKTNLNLLKTRDWIDIPVTYSNGRRALLTLQKGPEGQKVFDDVISSWQASGDAAVPTPATPPAQ